MKVSRSSTRGATHRAPNAIRVLVLEEDPGDAELLRAALRADGFSGCITAVESPGDVEAALGAVTFDIVVAAAGGGGRNPFELLRASRKRQPELPVVFFSTSSSQELAVELLKAGAADFVSKSRVLELVPAIDRALWEAEGARERAASEAALVESERRYRSIVERSARWKREGEVEPRRLA